MNILLPEVFAEDFFAFCMFCRCFVGTWNQNRGCVHFLLVPGTKILEPKSWNQNLKVTFENWSPVPHSLIIVEEDSVVKPQVGTAYFDGASTPNPTLATAPKKATFSFVVDEPGDFAFACGFPAHSANGQWIKLEVSDDFKKAEFITPKKK